MTDYERMNNDVLGSHIEQCLEEVQAALEEELKRLQHAREVFKLANKRLAYKPLSWRYYESLTPENIDMPFLPTLPWLQCDVLWNGTLLTIHVKVKDNKDVSTLYQAVGLILKTFNDETSSCQGPAPMDPLPS